MMIQRFLLGHRLARSLMIVATMFCAVTVARSESASDASTAPAGRLNFEAAALPAANVEVDLSQEMFKDLFGIGDAAIAGVAEQLLKSVDGNKGAQDTRLAAEQLEAARLIIQLAGNVVREVRVRVYESLPEGSKDAQSLFAPFDGQLRTGKWETLVRVRDDENTGRISVLRSGGTVQGIFIVASDGDSTVLANIVCEVSPENVKKLTSAATKIGLENGLGQVIKQQVKQLPGVVESHGEGVTREETPAVTPVPPAPPAAQIPKISE